jgi:N-acetylmuramic acid 6-phosphate etherase
MSETTESSAARYRGMDTWPTDDLVRSLWGGQMQAVAACLPALAVLPAAVEAAAARLGAGERGRLVYAGAGSAGMIAALDALDLGDTFDWPEARLAVLLAGGLDLNGGLSARTEDSAEHGIARIADLAVGADDVVIGVSASGASAFTVAALAEARRRGALTIGLMSMPGSELAAATEHVLLAETGAEVLSGSTRLGAGTAQKVLLNLFSTALMARLGAIYDNLMVNVRPENLKLRRRCVAIVSRIAGVGEAEAAAAISEAGDVKSAVLLLAGLARGEIAATLDKARGNLRAALAEAARRL